MHDNTKHQQLLMVLQVQGPIAVELASLINGNDQHHRHDNDDYDGGDGNDAASKGGAAVAASPSPSAAALSKRRLRLLLLLAFGLSIVVTTKLLVGTSSTFNMQANESRSRGSIGIEGSKIILDNDDYMSWAHTNLRWQPAMTSTAIDADNDNNCIPRFRLANSTIHCGYAGVSPITTDADGRQFCGGVPMELNYCVLPSEGSWIYATTASLPSSAAEGVSTTPLTPLPLPRRLGIHSINNDTHNILPRCKTMEEYTTGTYEGVGFDLEWVPMNCTSIPLSPFVWTQNMKCQATITMIGDSHVRNLFTATVNGLRGIEFFAEAHADDKNKELGVAESYEWRMLHDGTATDRFAVYSDTFSVDPNPFDDCPCNETVVKCLRIAFIWAPTFRNQLNQIHFVTKWKSDIVIVEPGNAYESSDLLSSNWTEKFDQLLEADDHLRLGILHFPWGKQPNGREDALKMWINGAHSDRKSYALQSTMYPPGNSQGRQTFHFACGLGRVDALNDNIKAVEPCSDLSDTAHIMALITMHFDALSTPA